MRQPAVADRFYPGSPVLLRQTIEELLGDEASPVKENAIAVVSPHAGYIYSGRLAAKTLNSVEIPETVIILGTNHHGTGSAIALSTESWNMPFGPVNIDVEVSDLLLAGSPHIVPDEAPHTDEHSLEVQVPFLQYLQPDLSIVPLVISRISLSLCREIGEALANAVKQSGKKILLLASTDMSHYEPRTSAETKDRMALKCVEEMEPEMLYRTVIENKISMCGFIPVTVTLFAAGMLGATSAKLIGYTDSGYVSGDSNQVVGYAGLTIS
ncbi:MAG: AmmeMemoRadiSam system protein B [Deltaproteobacteria bacterium]|nr:AmmeMemoRadiSam system protein B [Deltaproteobacteria bacterium]MBW2659173.1 AmmeMemoRadiSam system protein B [Deltaproteobacteria bacterium]